MTPKQIRKELAEHLRNDGCTNDYTTDDLYRQFHGIGEEVHITDLESVERWAQEQMEIYAKETQ